MGVDAAGGVAGGGAAGAVAEEEEASRGAGELLDASERRSFLDQLKEEDPDFFELVGASDEEWLAVINDNDDLPAITGIREAIENGDPAAFLSSIQNAQSCCIDAIVLILGKLSETEEGRRMLEQLLGPQANEVLGVLEKIKGNNSNTGSLSSSSSSNLGNTTPVQLGDAASNDNPEGAANDNEDDEHSIFGIEFNADGTQVVGGSEDEELVNELWEALGISAPASGEANSEGGHDHSEHSQAAG